MVTDYRIIGEGQSLGGAVLAALTFHINVYEGRTGYLPGAWDVLWSLSIEEVFYLAFPWFGRVVRSRGLALSVLSALALSLPVWRAALATGGNEIWVEKAYLPGIAAIAAGVVAAFAAFREAPVSAVGLRALKVMGTVGLVATLVAGDRVWALAGNGTLLVLTMSVGCLLVAFHGAAPAPTRQALPPRPLLSRPFRTLTLLMAILQAFGRLSYEIYLTHMFVVFGVLRFFDRAHDMRFGFLWYPPLVIASWGLSWIVSRVFSSPCDAAIRRWLDLFVNDANGDAVPLRRCR